MVVVLIIIAILIIIGFARQSNKTTVEKSTVSKAKRPQSLVNIETKTLANTTTLTVQINDKELKQHIENGTLSTSAKSGGRVEDIAGFYGRQSKSPDGSFIVLSADSYELNGKNRKGQLALLNGKRLMFKIALQRPNDAHVSNNGTVICCDWLNSNALTGKFLVFNSSGEAIFNKKTTANLGNAPV